MLKVLLQTLLGLGLSFTGLFLIFNFIQTIVDGPLFWLLIVSLPLIASGAFLLYKAGKSDVSVMKRVKVKALGEPLEEKGFEEKLKKDAALTNEFGKTNEARNRLKMLELSAEAQK